MKTLKTVQNRTGRFMKEGMKMEIILALSGAMTVFVLVYLAIILLKEEE